MAWLARSTVKVFGATWLWVLSLVVVGCQAALEVPYYNTPDLSPTWTAQNQDSFHQIADFQFTNQEGHHFGSADLANQVYVANFFFARCPTICPNMTRKIKTVADEFGNRVSFVSFSVTPTMDSVAVLKDFHDTHELPTNWNLLTGSRSEIYTLSRQSFFVEEELGFSLDSTDFLHTERCILVDRNQHIRGVYNASMALEMERLSSDIKIVLAEKS